MARTYTELYRFEGTNDTQLLVIPDGEKVILSLSHIPGVSVGEIRLTKDQWYDLKYLAISFTEKEPTDETTEC